MMSDFAYGDNEVDGVGCPATQAGFNPTEMFERCDHRGYGRIADQYDIYVELALFEEHGGDPESLDDPVSASLARKGFGSGHVDEETAREAWLDAIESSTSGLANEAGQEVAKELGWLSEEGSE